MIERRLGLTESLHPRLGRLAENCFEWICRRLQQKTDKWNARLRMVNNAAYAWRQMLFFLSLLPADKLDAILAWAEGYLGKQLPEFRSQFGPALMGLRSAVQGLTVEGQTHRFLGWTTGKHWLLN